MAPAGSLDSLDQLRIELTGLKEKGMIVSDGPLDRRGIDEHGLRTRLLESSTPSLYSHVIVTVADQAADSAGLWTADYDLLARMRSDLAEVVREHQDDGAFPREATAEAIAATLMCALPGYLLQLAIGGSKDVEGVPDALRALWPDTAAS